MQQDGTWGGHIELQALSKVLNRKICVINDSQQITNIGNSNHDEFLTIHLAYDRTMLHYSSLRKSKEIRDNQERNE